MNVALIGCGAIASAYADGLAACPALALTCCADLDADNAAALANRYGLTPYTDAGALLAAEDVDLVINLTIHTAHAAVTRICLEAGCHVVSEKPLAMTADEAQSLVTLAEEQGCVLACAPISGWADAQQMAGRLVRDGHIGPVRTATATGNFGRTTEWHPAPQPFLEIGPLYDGAVYPLTVLTTLFGPVERVRTADAALLLDEHAHNGRSFRVDTPDHVTAVLEMADGPLVHLTASAYVPHRTRHFSSLELHGDAGSLYLDDCGNFDGDTDAPLLQVARLGRPYRPFPLPRPPHPLRYASLAVDAARAAERGAAPLASARQAAHVVATLTAVETSADAGGGRPVERCGFDRPEQLPWTQDPFPHPDAHPLAVRGGFAADDRPRSSAPTGGSLSRSHLDPAPTSPPRRRGSQPEAALPSLPPIGFGCSRYRGGSTYVDLGNAMADALAAGIRLFDTAELYGTDAELGALLADGCGLPRERLFIVGKVWNTNHRPDHLRTAAEASLKRLGLEAFDAFLLHNPTAWRHQGPLGDLSRLSHEEATARTFPTTAAGDPARADVDLAETWAAMEGLVEDGRARHLGVCNVDADGLADLCSLSGRTPELVQVECHPYRHPTALIEAAHARGIRVMAHSPLSAPGLLEDETLRQVAGRHDVSTAQVVLRWNVEQGIVPIPSSTNPDHVHANADVFSFSLSDEDRAAIDALHRPDFSR